MADEINSRPLSRGARFTKRWKKLSKRERKKKKKRRILQVLGRKNSNSFNRVYKPLKKKFLLSIVLYILSSIEVYYSSIIYCRMKKKKDERIILGDWMFVSLRVCFFDALI